VILRGNNVAHAFVFNADHPGTCYIDCLTAAEAKSNASKEQQTAKRRLLTIEKNNSTNGLVKAMDGLEQPSDGC
jgi:hypothetical protein